MTTIRLSEPVHLTIASDVYELDAGLHEASSTHEDAAFLHLVEALGDDLCELVDDIPYVPPVVPPDRPLSALTKDELVALAAERRVEVRPSWGKEKLVEAIEAGPAPEGDEA